MWIKKNAVDLEQQELTMIIIFLYSLLQINTPQILHLFLYEWMDIAVVTIHAKGVERDRS
jgi:hypothetical protein